jgi:hypothetical protein
MEFDAAEQVLLDRIERPTGKGVLVVSAGSRFEASPSKVRRLAESGIIVSHADTSDVQWAAHNYATNFLVRQRAALANIETFMSRDSSQR